MEQRYHILGKLGGGGMGVVFVYDITTQDGQLAIAMQYLEGTTLKGKLTRALPADTVLDLAIQIADGLAAARTAYQNFFALWQHADPGLPVWVQAKTEYAKLH